MRSLRTEIRNPCDSACQAQPISAEFQKRVPTSSSTSVYERSRGNSSKTDYPKEPSFPYHSLPYQLIDPYISKSCLVRSLPKRGTTCMIRKQLCILESHGNLCYLSQMGCLGLSVYAFQGKVLVYAFSQRCDSVTVPADPSDLVVCLCT